MQFGIPQSLIIFDDSRMLARPNFGTFGGAVHPNEIRTSLNFL